MSTHHEPVGSAHCQECCCFFPNPADPTTNLCLDQGDTLADVAPNPAAAPNDQCFVCNREKSPSTVSSANTLLDANSEDEHVACNDFRDCTFNDHCTDAGTCRAEHYTCLMADFFYGDPSKDCEVCDGTGPESSTLGCKAKPGHFVYVESVSCASTILVSVHLRICIAPGTTQATPLTDTTRTVGFVVVASMARFSPTSG